MYLRTIIAIIQKNIDAIKLIGKDTTFVNDDAYVVGKKISQVNTSFYADNSDYAQGMECEKYLGKLKQGHEWLAFTFKEQRLDSKKYRTHFTKMMRGYENILRDAYSRMNVFEHKWTKGTSNEVSFITHYLKEKSSVLDLGCGTGRHAVELAKQGFYVKAVDNAPVLFEKTKDTYSDMKNLEFVAGDVRSFKDRNRYDAVICLFDVVGSYPDMVDNKKIIRNAYNLVQDGGIFILSVMNMELTEALIKDKYKGRIRSNSSILLDLPPSNTMQKSGAIFDPKYLALDKMPFSWDKLILSEIRDITELRSEICLKRQVLK